MDHSGGETLSLPFRESHFSFHRKEIQFLVFDCEFMRIDFTIYFREEEEKINCSPKISKKSNTNSQQEQLNYNKAQ